MDKECIITKSLISVQSPVGFVYSLNSRAPYFPLNLVAFEWKVLKGDLFHIPDSYGVQLILVLPVYVAGLPFVDAKEYSHHVCCKVSPGRTRCTYIKQFVCT